MYVKMGFSPSCPKNGIYRCYSFRAQCPVNRNKSPKSAATGYTTDDNYLHFISLKNWLVNVYSPDFRKSSTVQSTSSLWDAFGLSHHEHLSGAVVPPLNNENSLRHTNSGYLKLLICNSNLRTHPFALHGAIGDTHLLKLPIDRTVSGASRESPAIQMIAGLEMPTQDIRRSMFRSLFAQVGHTFKLDAFEALPAAMYTEGKIVTVDETDYDHPEMTLELRLNVIAFYYRCANSPFTSPGLDAWLLLATEEFGYALG